MRAPLGGRGGWTGFAVAALALAGLLFSLTPPAGRLDAELLDLEWAMLRKFAPRPAPDDIIIVGLDEATYAALVEPRALWHEPLAKALVRLASARPRALGLDIGLPERSFDAVRAGMDRVLMVGLATARERAPVVAALAIDVRTRAARPIHGPFLAVLGDEGLGVGLFARDGDGMIRRFAVSVPTEDGSFPTFEGRLCRALSRGCGEGLINFALGQPFPQVSLKQLLEITDVQLLERLFRDRIVLVGETQRHTDRVHIPARLAAWERGAPDTPGVVVHAQSLRTALLEAAPAEASRPVVMIVVALAALFALMRDWRLLGVAALVGAAALVALATAGLRGGLYLPLGAPLATLVLAVAMRTWQAVRAGRPEPGAG